MLCQLSVEGQVLEARNECILRAQEGTLCLCYLFLRGIFSCVAFVLVCFFSRPLTLLKLSLGEKWNAKKSKACSHSDVCFHT